MTEKNNFGEDIERVCAFCEKGMPLPGKDGAMLVVCPKKGLVDGAYVCGAFRYDPLKREPRRRKTDIEFEAVDIDK